MTICLDTNVLSTLFSGEPGAAERGVREGGGMTKSPNDVLARMKATATRKKPVSTDLALLTEVGSRRRAQTPISP